MMAISIKEKQAAIYRNEDNAELSEFINVLAEKHDAIPHAPRTINLRRVILRLYLLNGISDINMLVKKTIDVYQSETRHKAFIVSLLDELNQEKTRMVEEKVRRDEPKKFRDSGRLLDGVCVTSITNAGSSFMDRSLTPKPKPKNPKTKPKKKRIPKRGRSR